MKLKHFSDAAAFAAASKDFLLEHEVENNLLFGITESLISQPERYEAAPYIALVHGDDGTNVVALQTPPHNLVLSKAETLAALEPVVQDLKGKDLPGVTAPKLEAKAFVETWQDLTGQSYTLSMPQRIYKLEKVIPVKNVSGNLRRATQVERPLLMEWIRAFHTEALSSGPPQDPERIADSYLTGENRALYLWEIEDTPVSVAGYSGPTPTGIRINAVFTPAPHRRHGYASARVAHLSQLLLDKGYQFCCLFTDLRNPTSNHVYQTIGYKAVCDVHAYKFE